MQHVFEDLFFGFLYWYVYVTVKVWEWEFCFEYLGFLLSIYLPPCNCLHAGWHAAVLTLPQLTGGRGQQGSGNKEILADARRLYNYLTWNSQVNNNQIKKCLVSGVWCLMTGDWWNLLDVRCVIPAALCLLSAVCCLMFDVWCLVSDFCCLRLPKITIYTSQDVMTTWPPWPPDLFCSVGVGRGVDLLKAHTKSKKN